MFLKNISVFFLCFISIIFLTSCEKKVDRTKLYLEEAKVFASEKNWHAVISSVQKFILIENEAEHKDKIEAWFLIADATYSLGLIDKSIEILELMLEDPMYQNDIRCIIYERLVHYFVRIHRYRKAAEARLNLIQVKEMEQDEIARTLLFSALDYQHMKSYQKANIFFNKALEYVHDPALHAEILYNKAYGATVLLQNDEAEKYLLEALESNLIEPEVRGKIYYLLGDINEINLKQHMAYEYFEKALSLYPNEIFVQRRLALLEKKLELSSKK